MKKEELEYKIERIKKFVVQNRYTIEEFHEMEGYLKEIQLKILKRKIKEY